MTTLVLLGLLMQPAPWIVLQVQTTTLCHDSRCAQPLNSSIQAQVWTTLDTETKCRRAQDRLREHHQGLDTLVNERQERTDGIPWLRITTAFTCLPLPPVETGTETP